MLIDGVNYDVKPVTTLPYPEEFNKALCEYSPSSTLVFVGLKSNMHFPYLTFSDTQTSVKDMLAYADIIESIVGTSIDDANLDYGMSNLKIMHDFADEGFLCRVDGIWYQYGELKVH